MKFLFLVLALLANTIFAADISSPQAPIQNPFFYELEFQGEKSYLLGTIHFGVSLKDLPQDITNKHTESRIVFAERTYSTEDANFFRPHIEGLTEKTIVSQKDLNSPRAPLSPHQIEALIQLGYPRSIAEAFHQYPCSIYMLNFPKQYFPTAKMLDYDLIFKTILDDKKPLHGLDSDNSISVITTLESWLYRWTYGTQMTDSAEEEEVCYMSDEIETLLSQSQEEREAVFTNYRNGHELEQDIQNIEKMFSPNARNLTWLPQVLPEIKRGGAFIFVGQAHLVGRYGLLEMLQKSGVKIKRLSY